MIAPKRAVMIDHLGRLVFAEEALHPKPITCGDCRITYLPAAAPRLAVIPEDWVCDRCRARLEAGPAT
ncbi:MAG TPA: hypothetical protein VKI19_12940 [Acidimicrobiales bacterium]|nr:hypothetical protein [Acidimicrobiales bacterium]